MTRIAGLLITASLILGLISAATAYNPHLDAIDPGAEPLTLNAPAGRTEADPPQPLLDPATADAPIRLTPDLLEALAAAGADRIRVKEFGWSRWEGRWMFLLSCAGLLTGAGMLRSLARQRTAALASVERAPSETPEHALEAIGRGLADLIEDRASGGDAAARGRTIASRIDELRADHLSVIEDRQPEIMSRLGIAGHAQFMDLFAGAERQVNRAWSAAVDGAMGEAEHCLVQARAGMESARHRLG